jgi:uncharacterized protein with HEPN domain
MAEMRGKLTHEYFGVKLDVVWGTVHKQLPNVKTQIKKVLKEMNTAND